MKTCETCDSWKRRIERGSRGDCRKNAPTVLGGDDGVETYWPTTTAASGCGDHSQRVNESPVDSSPVPAFLQETDSPPSASVAPTRYAWYEEGSSAHGPFDTAELALADARYYFLNDPLVRTVGAGAIREIVPVHWLATDMETVLQGMDEFLGDDVELIDDDMAFAVPSDILEEAGAALTEALRAWVKKYVIANLPWFVETPEWHLVGAEPDPDDDDADADAEDLT